MIVVDTSVWINYFNGISSHETDLLDYELSHSRIIIGDLIIAELLQRFRNDSDYEKAKQLE
jgi:predicted nucleic acid-binding protein